MGQSITTTGFKSMDIFVSHSVTFGHFGSHTITYDHMRSPHWISSRHLLCREITFCHKASQSVTLVLDSSPVDLEVSLGITKGHIKSPLILAYLHQHHMKSLLVTWSHPFEIHKIYYVTLRLLKQPWWVSWCSEHLLILPPTFYFRPVKFRVL